MNLLAESNMGEFEEESSIASFVLMVVVLLFFIGGLFVAMYGLPIPHDNAPAKPVVKEVSRITVAVTPREELPALVASPTSGVFVQSGEVK